MKLIQMTRMVRMGRVWYLAQDVARLVRTIADSASPEERLRLLAAADVLDRVVSLDKGASSSS